MKMLQVLKEQIILEQLVWHLDGRVKKWLGVMNGPTMLGNNEVSKELHVS